MAKQHPPPMAVYQSNAIRPGTSSRTIESIIDGNQKLTKDSEIADAFNKFFVLIGPNLAKTMHESAIPQPLSATEFSIHLKPATADEIETVLTEFQDSEAGIDHVKPKTLSMLPNIATLLTRIINNIFPKALKRAVVSPIHEVKDNLTMSYYRPVSVLISL